MKKAIFFAVLAAFVALTVGAAVAAEPAATTGKLEFTMGGYVKLDSWWESAINDKNNVWKAPRNSQSNWQHGRFAATASSTRFNFAIKGPKLWGAQVTGFIECDFDANGAQQIWNPGNDTLDTGVFRMRLAFVRLNWADTQLLFGQSFSFMGEFFPEMVNDGAGQYRSTCVYRPAQISVIQKFLDGFEVGAMIATPRQVLADEAGNNQPGEQSETPHLEAKLAYSKDLYGKAAYYGTPRGFTAQVAAFWQRDRFRPYAVATNTWGEFTYAAATAGRVADTQYLSAWGVQGTLFVPVIPTTSANLAGTASILTQWHIGQGMSRAVGGWFSDDSFLRFDGIDAIGVKYKRQFTPQIAGFVQGQYYFNNEWYVNLAWAFMRKYGVPFTRNGAVLAGNYEFATPAAVAGNTGAYDFVKYSNQIAIALWYRPITAMKFGIQYAYTNDHYFQETGFNAAGACANQGKLTSIGESHRVQFVTFFFF